MIIVKVQGRCNKVGKLGSFRVCFYLTPTKFLLPSHQDLSSFMTILWRPIRTLCQSHHDLSGRSSPTCISLLNLKANSLEYHIEHCRFHPFLFENWKKMKNNVCNQRYTVFLITDIILEAYYKCDMIDTIVGILSYSLLGLCSIVGRSWMT